MLTKTYVMLAVLSGLICNATIPVPKPTPPGGKSPIVSISGPTVLSVNQKGHYRAQIVDAFSKSGIVAKTIWVAYGGQNYQTTSYRNSLSDGTVTFDAVFSSKGTYRVFAGFDGDGLYHYDSAVMIVKVQ